MGRPKHVSDEEILDAARACFRELGPSVSTTVIAGRLEISQAALFKRFGTKEELMVAALGPPPVPPWLSLLNQGPDGRPIKVQLREIGRVLNQFFEQYMPNFAVLRACGDPSVMMERHYDVAPPLLGHRAMTDWFRRAGRRGLVRGRRAKALAMMFLAAFQGRSMIQHLTNGALPLQDADAYINDVVDLLCDGILPEADA
ncbi:MAG: TetR/AcrR family transcriptional regulator [Deltaproteobacteria bacterium]|nr:TetR/AcrR family transcriptional regulator [Deltaproteobacteria bacterium]